MLIIFLCIAMNSAPQQEFNTLVETTIMRYEVKDQFHAEEKITDNLKTKIEKPTEKIFKDYQAARERAAVRRWKVAENLDRFLIEFEANFIKSGAKVLWARDKEEAQMVINDLLIKNCVKEVYTDGNQLLKEIELQNYLYSKDIKISQPSNIDAHTQAVITEASYFIANPGVIVIGENSRKLYTAFYNSRCVIILASINDILPNLSDLSLFLPLKKINSYTTETDVTLLFGPNQQDETINAELHFLIIDNGRSNLLADKLARQLAWCINCQACNLVCPVVTSIGMKEGVYEGPSRAVQMPYIIDFEEQQYLNRSSTLCGACTAVCPVHINLQQLFVHNRKKSVALQINSQKEKWFYVLWKKTMLKRDKFSFGAFKSNRLVVETVYERVWGTKENQPAFAKKTFNEMWKERQK